MLITIVLKYINEASVPDYVIAINHKRTVRIMMYMGIRMNPSTNNVKIIIVSCGLNTKKGSF